MKTEVGNLCSPFLLSQLGNLRPCLLKLRTSAASPVFKHCFAAAIKDRAAASYAVVEVEPTLELTKNFLKPVLGGGNIIDSSCGSGMFSRLFAKSGLFSLVVALDYSENMSKECYGFTQREENFPKEELSKYRAAKSSYQKVN